MVSHLQEALMEKELKEMKEENLTEIRVEWVHSACQVKKDKKITDT